MNNLLSNVWLKRGVALFSLVYGVMLTALAYATFMYKLVFDNEKTFFVLYVIVNILFLVLMIYTRKQIVTRIQGMLLLPVVFFILIFNIGNWVLFVPAFLVSVIIFFACSANENVKTIFGTCYIIMYVVGIIVFMLIRRYMGNGSEITVLNNELSPTNAVYEMYDMDAVDELMLNNVSPDGKYRYYLVDEKDNNTGRVKLYVEPNDLDMKYRFFTLVDKGHTRTVYTYNQRGIVPQLVWIYDSGRKEYNLSYKFGDEQVKTSRIIIPDKDYFSFLLN